MSRFFDDLEAQLHGAARARARGGPRPGSDDAEEVAPRRGMGWLRGGLGHLPVVIAVATTVAVVVAAFILLGHRTTTGHPAPAAKPPSVKPPSVTPPGGGMPPVFGGRSGRRLQRELQYMSAATRSVLDSRVCQVVEAPGVSYVHGSPGRALLAALPVLARPATAADAIHPAALAGAHDIYTGHIRLARVIGRTAYYFVPTRNDLRQWVPSHRCFALQRAALRRYLPHIPASLRIPTEQLQARLIAYNAGLVAHEPRDSVCLVYVAGNGSGADCGLTAAQSTRGTPPEVNGSLFVGIAPGGVASVTLRFPARRGVPARAASGRVIGDVYAIRVPGAGLQHQPAVIWRAASGRIVKTTPYPSPQAGQRYCRSHMLACLSVMNPYTSGGATGESAASSAGAGATATRATTTTSSTTAPAATATPATATMTTATATTKATTTSTVTPAGGG